MKNVVTFLNSVFKIPSIEILNSTPPKLKGISNTFYTSCYKVVLELLDKKVHNIDEDTLWSLKKTLVTNEDLFMYMGGIIYG